MKHTIKITLFLILMFFLAQILGIAVLNSYIDVPQSKTMNATVYKELPYDIERPEMSPTISVLYIIAGVIIGTIIVLLIIKFRKPVVWKVWYFLAVLISLSIAFSAFISSGISFIISGILAWLKTFQQYTYINIAAELFIYAGIAAIFVPVLNVISMLVLLSIISVYDMYAVWHSKHMVEMAKFQTDSKLFAGLAVPYNIGKNKKDVQKVDGKSKKSEKDSETRSSSNISSESRTAVLGGGDIAFALLFAGVILQSFGLWYAVIIAFSTTISLAALFFMAEKDKFYPAMPFISFGCFIGYAIVLAVKSAGWF